MTLHLLAHTKSIHYVVVVIAVSLTCLCLWTIALEGTVQLVIEFGFGMI